MATKARDAFRTISEVADWLDVPAHVLRFWESKFTQIKPVKRAGGRRYYRPDDMELIGGIKKLLHEDGMTIRGVQKMLKEDGIKAVSAMSPSLDAVDDAASPRTIRQKDAVADLAETMEDVMPPETDELEDDDPETLAAWDADAEEDTAPETPEAPERAPLDVDTTAPEPPEPAEEEQVAEPEPAPEAEPEEQAAASEPEPTPEPEPEEVPEAPFIEVAEEEPQIGGDNVVELAPRADPAPESEPEAREEATADPEPEAQPKPALNLDAIEAKAPIEEQSAPAPSPDLQADTTDTTPEKTVPPAPELEEKPEPEAEPEAQAPPAEPETTLPPSAPVQLDPNREKTLPPTATPTPPPTPPAPEPAPAPAAEIAETVEPSAEGFQLSEAQKAAQALKRKLRGADDIRLHSATALAAPVARLQTLRDRLARDLPTP